MSGEGVRLDVAGGPGGMLSLTLTVACLLKGSGEPFSVSEPSAEVCDLRLGSWWEGKRAGDGEWGAGGAGFRRLRFRRSGPQPNRPGALALFQPPTDVSHGATFGERGRSHTLGTGQKLQCKFPLIKKKMQVIPNEEYFFNSTLYSV